MKNKIVTISLREIKKNFRRFLSLAVLSFLGVSVFVGIKVTGPDMIKTVDTYYDQNNAYDIRIVSTLGLTDEDIVSISKVDDSFTVYGTHSKDASFKTSNNSNAIIKIMELDKKYNQVVLKEGRLPENKDEIAVEIGLIKKTDIKIGDYIELELEEDDNTINTKKIKIVGTIVSPLYLINGNGGVSRGNTTIGSGKVNFYSYTTKDFFNMDYYTEVNINVKNKFVTDSDKYNALIDEVTDKIEKIKETREKERFNQIIKQANEEIDKTEEEALIEFENAKAQLDEANTQLENGHGLLYSGEIKLKTLKAELEKGQDEIKNGYEKISDAERELENAKIQLDSAVDEINKKFSKYQLDYNDFLTIKKVLDGMSLTKKEVISLIPTNLEYYDGLVEAVNYIYDNGYDNLLDNIIKNINREKIVNIIPTTIENYDEVCNYIRTVSTEQIKKDVVAYLLDSENAEMIKQKLPNEIIGYQYLVDAIEKYEITVDKIIELFNGIEQIKTGYLKYDIGMSEIESGKKKLDEGTKKYEKYLEEYNKALGQLNTKKVEYNKGLQLFQTKLDEYDAKKTDVEKNIEDARQNVSKMDKAQWFIYNRKNNSDYMSYLNSTQSVENLSGLFPVVFFIVAVFISLLSMSRMAFEDRGEIGTLKSLGFSNMQIRYKYIIYSLMATLLGGILGAALGYYFIPWMIFETYGMLYEIPMFIYNNGFFQIFLGIFISIICICGATVITINSLIKEKTTDLLRPKAPLSGKTILLEKIKIVWNRLSFSNKVTIRNIFRYKKRICMTILGIVGCTVLLLSGYAIRDSIVNVVGIQYSEIFKYDDSVYLNDKLSQEQIEKIFDNEHIKEKVNTQSTSVKANERDITLCVPEDEEKFKDMFILKDKNLKEKLELENNKVIITSKLAKILKLNKNDKIEFTDKNNKKYCFVISSITQNYLGDFIYMNKTTYEESMEEYKTNMTYITIDDFSNENDVTSKLLENANVLGVSSTQISQESLNNIFASLDTIVVILVIFSGALAFVVLYNLSYINISERQREIATLKVLGFTNREIDGYIIKEEVIITIIGIFIGLFIGTWFSMLIVETIEIDIVEFIKKITTLSYLKTFGFMILFSIIVNVRVHFALKKIDMIESLKSIE